MQVKGRPFWSQLEEQYQSGNRQRNIEMIEAKLEKMIEIARAKKEELVSECSTEHQSEINENIEIPDPMEISFDENDAEKTAVS